MLDKLQARIADAIGAAVVAELRLLRVAVEIGVDSYRAVNGMEPVAAGAASSSGSAENDLPLQPEEEPIIPDGDYLSMWLLTKLAEENFIPVEADTDLEKLGLEKGWIDREGHLLVVPEAAKSELTPEVLRELGVY